MSGVEWSGVSLQISKMLLITFLRLGSAVISCRSFVECKFFGSVHAVDDVCLFGLVR